METSEEIQHQPFEKEGGGSGVVLGMQVNIKRTDGRVHGAVVSGLSGINLGSKSVTVEWFEKNQTKEKEIDLNSLVDLNPQCRPPATSRYPTVPPTTAVIRYNSDQNQNALVIDQLTNMNNIMNGSTSGGLIGGSVSLPKRSMVPVQSEISDKMDPTSNLGQGQSQGQDVIPPLNDDFTHMFNNYLAREEILNYLDGSALINLSSVNREIRGNVISSPNYKKKVNLVVSTKSLSTQRTNLISLPPWTANLTSLTFSNSGLVLFSRQKYLTLARILPNLSSLVVLDKSHSHSFYSLDNILNLSSNLKSISIPYNFLLNPIDFNLDHTANYGEFKLTTTTHMVKFNKNFEQNLGILANNCINLKSFSCQEVTKFGGRYVNEYDEEDYKFFNEILPIIENNSQSLVKLEFGLSQLVTANTDFSSKLSKISLPNLKYLDLRMKDVNIDDDEDEEPPVRVNLDILKNLQQPLLLTTLKLTVTRFPIELFNLIPQKFPQLKSLSLKASKYDSADLEIYEDRWSLFLQSLPALQELEITRFVTYYYDSDFGLEISEKFPDFLQKHSSNLRKLSLKGMKRVLSGPTFYNGIVKLTKLKELALTGCRLYLDNFLMLCTHLKDLEKLEVSHLYADKLNAQSNTQEDMDYRGILTAFSSLKYLKELSIHIWSGNFRQVLGSISFPYLKRLTLCNANLSREEIENIIVSNGMLKEFSIASLKYEDYLDPDKDFKTVNERKNMKIRLSSKQVELNPNNDEEQVREDFDPDSVPLSRQGISWSEPESFFDSDDSNIFYGSDDDW